jgi:hypothetical protein
MRRHLYAICFILLLYLVVFILCYGKANCATVQHGDKIFVTNDNTVTLNIAVTDTGSGLKSMQFKSSLSDAWTDEIPFASTHNFTLSIPADHDGSPIIIAGRFTDNVGNYADISTVTPLYVDAQKPAGSVEIKVDVVVRVGVN